MAALSRPLVLLSGFGPFESFALNPSAAVVQALAADPPAGVRVRSAVLPVSFARAPAEWDAAVGECEPPQLFLALGVAREAGFRFERRAGPSLEPVPRPDVDGRSARDCSHPGPLIETRVPLEGLLESLRRRGVEDAFISDSAGGFVCERVYHHLLERSASSGTPALFLHLPPEEITPLRRQVEVVGWVLEELLDGGTVP